MHTISMASEEVELMGKYVAGDAGAFRVLYERVAPKLLNYLTRMSGRRALAEDLLQQTFLKVHRARASYVAGANPVPWIYAIAHRTFIDETRKHKRAKVVLARDPDSMPEARAHVSGLPEDQVPTRQDPELTRAALAALEDLPANQRQAVILTKLDGKSIAEAATLAGTTPGAMKVRAHRGYAALRKALSGARA